MEKLPYGRNVRNPLNKMIPLFTLGIISLLLAACNSSSLIKVGDPAPDFTLSSAVGTEVSISDFEGKRPVLLYFHMAKG